MKLNELPDDAVPPALLASVRQWLFEEYVHRFIGMNPSWVPAFQLKVDHTRRVGEEILFVGQRLDLSSGALRLAQLTALLHDIARFEQYAQHQTYSDARSFDHARVGVEIIRGQGVLDPLRPEVQEIVLTAVRNHNRAAIPNNGSPADIFFSRLLRDADKLDIWRVVIDEYRSPRGHAFARLDLPDTPGCSAATLRALSHGQMIRLTDLRNLNDFKLLQISWVYDLSFQPTFQRVHDRRYVESLLDLLPKQPEIERVGKSVLAHVAAQTEETSRPPKTARRFP